MSKSKTTGLLRNTIDKFYTKPEIAKECFEEFQRIIDPNPQDIFIEPSAGNGSFTNWMKLSYPNVFSYDIQPESENIIEQDFLQLNTNIFKSQSNSEAFKTVHMIGNPPFGRQSSLAKLFIQKSCSFATSISFILPKSFKKDSFQKSFDPYFHLIFEKDLTFNSFMVGKIEYDVPCVFQIWVKKNQKRKIANKVEPIGFRFVKKEESPDFSIRRVGVNAGKIDSEIKDKSIQSHYFILLNRRDNELDNQNTEMKILFMEKYKQIHFDHNNTVGPKSISKQELISKMNYLFT